MENKKIENNIEEIIAGMNLQKENQKNISKNEVIVEYFKMRGLTTASTIRKYITIFDMYCNEVEPAKTPEELLDQAEKEEEDGVKKRKRSIKKRFLKFKQLMDKKGYSWKTKVIALNLLRTFYREYEIELPKAIRVEKEEAPIVGVEELPSKEDFRNCHNVAPPLFRAALLVSVSSGLAAADIRNLRVKVLMDEFRRHGVNEINLKKMEKIAKKKNIIPLLKGQRQKNGVPYCTFMSPEAVISIINYWKTDCPESEDDYIFRNPGIMRGGELKFKGDRLQDSVYFRNFSRMSDKAGIPKEPRTKRVMGHTPRRFFANMLIKGNVHYIIGKSFMGHKLTPVDMAYYKEQPREVLIKEYRKVLPYVSILEDVKLREISDSRLAKLEEEVTKNKEENEKLKAIIKAKTDWEKVEKKLEGEVGVV